MSSILDSPFCPRRKLGNVLPKSTRQLLMLFLHLVSEPNLVVENHPGLSTSMIPWISQSDTSPNTAKSGYVGLYNEIHCSLQNGLVEAKKSARKQRKEKKTKLKKIRGVAKITGVEKKKKKKN
ncbi:unnamed protein product [Hymenolepis diminuta]|uniref:Uncharacterized protein n=1 Tax=Hymenolepis diminuta TaxID=6216 RepID=A0A564Y4M3_HYMDI|nr:unnamed protein product [Hymenolepis diminuta]